MPLVHQLMVLISFSGSPVDGDVVRINSFDSAAKNMTVLYDDSKKIAAAELFGVKNAPTNLSSARAKVSVFTSEASAADNSLDKIITNNLNVSAGVNIAHSTIEPKATLQAGLKDVALTLKKDRTSELNLQVFTREEASLWNRRFNRNKQINDAYNRKWVSGRVNLF